MIKDEAAPYKTLDGYLNPCPVPPGSIRTSGNQIMYTSEYYILLKQNGQLSAEDVFTYFVLMEACIDEHGFLNRFPLGQGGGQTGPDDYYGLLSAYKTIGLTSTARTLLWAMITHFGFMNNDKPGTLTASSFLGRQPGLWACMIAASFPSLFNPLHLAIRTFSAPFFLISSAVTAIGSLFHGEEDLDSWRLGWHLLNTIGKVSISGFLASIVYNWRLKRIGGIQAVAAKYYKPEGSNMFSRWWKNLLE